MTLSCAEFIRRFEQHILPARFTRIRTNGYLENRNRKERINEVLKQMKLPLHKGTAKVSLAVTMLAHYAIDLTACLCCKNKTMQLVHIYYLYKHANNG